MQGLSFTVIEVIHLTSVCRHITEYCKWIARVGRVNPVDTAC